VSDSRDNLLRRFRAGDRDAILTVARLARGVVGHRGYYIPPTEREDLIQEAVIQTYRAVADPGFQPTLAVEAFVRSVAQRRCVDWVRRRRPMELINPATAATAPDPERETISAERRARARAALAALGFSCRQLIRLRVREGLTYKEIAARLSRTEQGVRVQMYKCLKRAKELLDTSDRREE